MSLFKIFIFIIILNLLYQNILKSKKYRRYNYFQKKKKTFEINDRTSNARLLWFKKGRKKVCRRLSINRKQMIKLEIA